MNKILAVAAVVFLSSCGGSQAKKDAEEVCECFSKANAANDTQAKSKCLDQQRKAFTKYGNKPEELNEFNQAFIGCFPEISGTEYNH